MSKKFVWWLLLLLSVQDIGAQPKGTLRLVFAGDVLLDRGVRQRIRAVGVDRLFAPSIDSLFHSADIVVTNLECPATKIKAPVNKRFIFRAEPEWLAALHRHGITHLNMANNHSVDQGRNALEDTRHNIIKYGMVPVGAGSSMDEASQPTVLATSPRKIVMLTSVQLALENWAYLEDVPCVCQRGIGYLVQQIDSIKRRSPSAFVIVSLHWGVEHTLIPVMQQRVQAHRLIDAGADCLICHHTHTMQSIEVYRGKYIYYSIGNFIFDQHRPINSKACAVQIDISSKNAKVKTIPIYINNCRPVISTIY